MTTNDILIGESSIQSYQILTYPLAAEVETAAHWTTAASYFRPFDRNTEVDALYDACDELRGYGYRYRSVPALIAAEAAPLAILEIWTPELSLKGWCRAINALGATRWRLAKFEHQSLFSVHAEPARKPR